MSTQLVPASQRVEKQLLACMSESLQEMAQKGRAEIGEGHVKAVMAAWRLGDLIRQAESAPEQYKVVGKEMGKKSVIQILALFWGLAAEKLISLKLLVDAFPKEDQIRSLTSKPMVNGDYLSESHFHELRKLVNSEDPKDGHARVAKILRDLYEKKAMSSHELGEYINAHAMPKSSPSRKGGRKLRVPNNPVQGLQRIDSMTCKFIRGCEEIFPKIKPSMEDANLGDQEILLDKLRVVRDDLSRLIEAGGNMHGDIVDVIRKIRDAASEAGPSGNSSNGASNKPKPSKSHGPAVKPTAKTSKHPKAAKSVAEKETVGT